VQRVLDGAALAQELGVGRHVDPDALAVPFLLARDHLGEPLTGVGRHRGLLDQHEVLRGVGGDVAPHGLDVRQVRAATRERRRADADEDDLGPVQRFLDVGRERSRPAPIVSSSSSGSSGS
jgi:hypothetical protein